MDHALPAGERAAVERVLETYRGDDVSFHAVRTRQAGRRSFVSLHLLVPGVWTVTDAHALADRLEREIQAAVPGSAVITHLEPSGDSLSLADADLERVEPSA